MAIDVGFRALAASDFETLLVWFADPEISEWWAPPRDIDSIEAKYLPRVLGSEPTSMWMIVLDGVDAGMAQTYRHVDHPEHDRAVGIERAVGIDYLLSAEVRGRRLAPVVLAALASHALAAHSGTEVCVATPSTTNVRSCRALAAAGFVPRGEITGADEVCETVYVLSPGS